MYLTLSKEIEAYLRSKVESGAYDSPAEVVEESLLLLQERDHLRGLLRDRLLSEIASGVFQADNRQVIRGAEVFKGLFDKAHTPQE
jgi:antitoxin ParD1/3/4